MKTLSRNLILFLSLLMAMGITMNPAQAEVQLCFRKAQIIKGLVNHYWIKTSSKNAGMGPADLKENEIIGNNRTDALFSPVYVIDHTKDTPDQCIDIDVASEHCVDEALTIGKYLGRFQPFNNCFTFAISTLRKCGAYGENFSRYHRDVEANNQSSY